MLFTLLILRTCYLFSILKVILHILSLNFLLITQEHLYTSSPFFIRCHSNSCSRFLSLSQGGGSEAPLGRVYVDDPDDWDAADKSYAWDGPAHPLFSLHPRHGTVFASSVVREGR